MFIINLNEIDVFRNKSFQNKFFLNTPVILFYFKIKLIV